VQHELPGSLKAVAVRALDNVSIEIHGREVVGLIGPNGAGKSTLVNLLTGFDSPSSGRVILGTTDITSLPAPDRVRLGIARTFQHGHTFPGLTVRENVEVAALGVGAKPRVARSRASSLLELLGMGAYQHAEASTLAHGDERLLGVARALATEPHVLLLDEPAAGLNEGEIAAFAATIRSIRDEQQVAVLLIDHNVPLVLGVCDRIHVLDQGVTLAAGSPEDIRNHPAVVEAYLGDTPIDSLASR
jgi:branched-chain amino acid transport system ATP-binding protein